MSHNGIWCIAVSNIACHPNEMRLREIFHCIMLFGPLLLSGCVTRDKDVETGKNRIVLIRIESAEIRPDGQIRLVFRLTNRTVNDVCIPRFLDSEMQFYVALRYPNGSEAEHFDRGFIPPVNWKNPIRIPVGGANAIQVNYYGLSVDRNKVANGDVIGMRVGLPIRESCGMDWGEHVTSEWQSTSLTISADRD